MYECMYILRDCKVVAVGLTWWRQKHVPEVDLNYIQGVLLLGTLELSVVVGILS
jgi:hypothetical protein